MDATSRTLTIGELAAYAGTTVRAVRHYHARGLLPEPGRDESGYRRYDAQAVIDLIRIRTLAGAGVPLAHVATMLEADPEEFSARLRQIDEDLRARIAELERARRGVAELEAGDAIALPREVVDYLERMGELGVGEEMRRIERDGWIMVAARHPEKIAGWIADKRAVLEGDDEFAALMIAGYQAMALDPDDPRLIELADRTVHFLERTYDPQQRDGAIDPTIVRLLDDLALTTSPNIARFRELLADRGWDGWTELKRVE